MKKRKKKHVFFLFQTFECLHEHEYYVLRVYIYFYAYCLHILQIQTSVSSIIHQFTQFFILLPQVQPYIFGFKTTHMHKTLLLSYLTKEVVWAQNHPHTKLFSLISRVYCHNSFLCVYWALLMKMSQPLFVLKIFVLRFRPKIEVANTSSFTSILMFM